MLKMQTIGGKYVIFDRGRIVKFNDSYDAWQYIFICREIRPRVEMGVRSLYPVRSLNPVPERRTKEKRLSIAFPEVMSTEYETAEPRVPRRQAATYEWTGV